MMYQRPAMPPTPNLAAKTALNPVGIPPAQQLPTATQPVNPTLGGVGMSLPFDPNQGMQAGFPQAGPAMMPTAQLPSPMGLPGQSLATQRPSMAPLQQAQSAALRRF